jgi:hypothetical protein
LRSMQHLVDESRDIPSHTKKYYGVYVLLVFAIDRIQRHFVREVDENFIAGLDSFEKEAARNTADAQSGLAKGDQRELLSANIVANSRTSYACRLMAEILRSHRRSVIDENRTVQTLASQRTMSAAKPRPKQMPRTAHAHRSTVHSAMAAAKSIPSPTRCLTSLSHTLGLVP